MSSATAYRRFIRLNDFYADGRVSKSTALKWYRQGRLRTVKVDGLTFCECLDEFLERQAAEHAAIEAQHGKIGTGV